MMEHAALFTVYEKTLSVLCEFGFFPKDTRPSLAHVGFSGFMSGVITSLILTPFELIKIKIQVAQLNHGIYSTNNFNNSSRISNMGTLRTFIEFIKQNRFRNLFKGLGFTGLREAGGGLIWFSTYEAVLRSYERKEGSVSKTGIILSGGVAGITFNLALYPADTIKSVIQGHKDINVDWKRVIQTIYKNEGVRGFYNGMGITLLRAVPSNALVFLLYDYLKNKF
jgi:ornithine carrier protein